MTSTPAEGRKIPLPELIGDAFGQQILERLVPDDPLIAVPDLAVRKAHDFALRQIRDAKFLSGVEDRGETLLRFDVLAFAHIAPPLQQFFVQFRDDGPGDDGFGVVRNADTGADEDWRRCSKR
ncbi:MAG: hypothetical protein WC026_08355 [Hyphomicrobium sp.]|uniref:hypothetical protein n=1 Tax=Hyphomicrobium sp. TaxID=82 RepID=UPI003567A67F